MKQIDTNPIKYAVLYARFSPRPNSKECDSCDVQLHDLRKFCDEYGYEVVGEFRDDAVSGAVENEIARPGIWDAILALRKGYTLICRDLSRIARDMPLMVEIERRIKVKGARIRTIREGECKPDDPMSLFIYRIMSAFAELQRSITRETTRAKMRQRQIDGLSSGNSAPPYGWKKIMDRGVCRLVPRDDEQAIRDEIIARIDNKETYRGIAADLRKRGILNRKGLPFKYSNVFNIIRRYKNGREPRMDEHKRPIYTDRFVEEPIGTLQ